MNNYWSRLLLFVAILVVPIYANDPSTDIQTLLDKFNNIASPMADALLGAQKLSGQAAFFLKASFPACSIVLQSLQIASQPESPEYIALMKLTDTMNRQFDQLEYQLNYSVAVINLNEKLTDYNSHVTSFMPKLKREVMYMTNASINKTAEDVVDFIQDCKKTDLDPQLIIDYIATTIKGCPKTLEENANQNTAFFIGQIYALTREAAQKKFVNANPLAAFRRLEYDSTIGEIIYSMNRADFNDAKSALNSASTNLMRRLETKSVNLTHLNDFASELKVAVNVELENFVLFDNPELCILDDIVKGRAYHHAPIFRLIEIIKTDIAHLLYYLMICGQFRYENRPTRMFTYFNDTIETVARVMNFMVDWTPKNLISSFPTIEKEMVESYIERFRDLPPKKDRRTFAELAQNISNVLSVVGNPAYQRQILITDNAEIGQDYTDICPEHWCFALYNKFGIHILVTRFDLADQPRLMRAQNWANGVNNKIVALIEADYNIGSVVVLKQHLEKDYNLTDNQHYHSMAILRFWTLSSGDCLNGPFAHKEVEIEQFSATYNMSYYFAGSTIHDCEMYHLFFFI